MKGRQGAAEARPSARKRGAGPKPPEAGNGTDAGRLCLVGVKVDTALRREIDAYAEAHGVSRSRAAGHYLEVARETLREREGVPGGRADELLEAVDGLRAAVDLLGPPAFGMLRLLAHWAAHGGAVKVTEDELLAELRAVGADEWEQAVADAERDLQEPSATTAQKGRR